MTVPASKKDLGRQCEPADSPATRPAPAKGEKPPVSAEVIAKWQGIVDLMAKMLAVPAALITRSYPPAIEIFVCSDSPQNPYRKGGRVILDPIFKMFCQMVMTRRRPLYIPDARQDAGWNEWKLSPDIGLGMTCYLGFPLLWPDGEVFGTICALDRGDNPDVARYQDLVREFRQVVEGDLKLLVTTAERELAVEELQTARAELEQRVTERTAELRRANERLGRECAERRQAEEELRRANGQIFTVLESITDAFTAFDREWRFTYANERAARNMGKSRQELIGQRLWDLFPEEVGGEGYKQADRAMTERVPVHYEYFVRRVGIWFESHVFPTAEGVSIYSHDITDRRRAEEALLRANAKVTEVLESITDAFVALDRQWRFTYVNDRAAQYLGRPKKELIGQNMWDLIPEMVGTEAYRLTHEAVERQEAVHYENFVPTFGRWFMTHAYPTKEGLALYGSDITDRKLAEEELRRADAKLTEILESITDVFVAFDREWRYTYVNERATLLIGRAREELLGRRLWDMFPEYEKTRNGRLVRRAMAERTPVHYESYVRRIRRWVETYAYPTKEGISMYVRDVTDRKRAERALQRAKRSAEAASRAKDQFIAVLSHELRTPLTPVLAAVSAWERKENLSQQERADTRMIRRNVELEARLIDDLLDSTRVTRGKVDLHHEVIDVHDCINRVLETCGEEARRKGVELTADLRAREHHAWADPFRVQQIFWNLLNNAIKFTPPGGKVRVTSDSVDGRLTVDVSDTGVGLEPGTLPRLFKPFEQAEQTKARRFGGLGLGLTIAKRLTELHKGRLTAVSEGKDKGSTFTVDLPTVAPKPAPKHAEPPKPTAEAAGQRILLVEDDPDTLRIMSRLLRGMGYRVSPAENVHAALELAAHEHFDLLISDLGLPDGTGLDVMRRVKDSYGLKGLAISGYGTDDDMRLSREAGFQQLLTKPVTLNTLETAVRQTMAIHN